MAYTGAGHSRHSQPDCRQDSLPLHLRTQRRSRPTGHLWRRIEDSHDYGYDNPGVPLCLRTVRVRQVEGQGQPRNVCPGDEVLHHIHPSGVPRSDRLSRRTKAYHRPRLLVGTARCAHCDGCRDNDGRVLQPLVLVQTHRQDHLGSLVLRRRMRCAHSRQRAVRAAIWLYGVCMGWFCRLRNGHGAVVSCRSEEVSDKLSAQVDRRLCGYNGAVLLLHELRQRASAQLGGARSEHCARDNVRSAHHIS